MVKTSKVKSSAWVYMGPILAILIMGSGAMAQDIMMESAPHQDTQILVGPDAGAQGRLDDISIDSEPGNDTLILITPTQKYPDSDMGIDTIIVTPEIFLKEK